MKVCYLFRKKNPVFFSIEKVFDDVIGACNNLDYKKEFVAYNKGIKSVFKNLFFFKTSSKNEIIHITGDIHYMAFKFPNYKTILTIHDVGILKNATGIKKYFLKKIWFDLPLKKLKYITVISEATKNELLSLTNCEENKIVVIANPINALYNASLKEFNTKCPTILLIGITENKNLERTIKALEYINCTLLIIGNPNNTVIELLINLKINYNIKVNLTDQEVYEAYKSCDIVSFCSLLEGFGLPIIEAQATGRVVITSNIEPMLSVGANGALYVNPYDIESIKNGFLQIIANKELRSTLITNGLENVKRFEAKKIANDYVALYESVYNENKQLQIIK